MGVEVHSNCKFCRKHFKYEANLGDLIKDTCPKCNGIDEPTKLNITVTAGKDVKIKETRPAPPTKVAKQVAKAPKPVITKTFAELLAELDS